MPIIEANAIKFDNDERPMPMPEGVELSADEIVFDDQPTSTEVPRGTLDYRSAPAPTPWYKTAFKQQTLTAPDPSRLLDMPAEQVEDQPSSLPETALTRGLASGTTGLFKQVGTAMDVLGTPEPNSPHEQRRAKYLDASGYSPDEIAKMRPAGEAILKTVGKATSDYWDKVAEEYGPTEDIQGSIVKNPNLLKSPKWWSYNIGNMLPSTVASIAAFMAGGPTAGGLVGGGLEGLSTYEEMVKQGESPENAKKAMLLMGVGSTALNAVPFATALNKVPGLKAGVVRHLVASGAEGVTEWLEEPWEAISKGIATGKIDPEEIKRQAIEGLNVLPVAAIQGLLIPGAGALSGRTDAKAVNTFDAALDRMKKAGAPGTPQTRPVATPGSGLSIGDAERRALKPLVPSASAESVGQKVDTIGREQEAARDATLEGLRTQAEADREASQNEPPANPAIAYFDSLPEADRSELLQAADEKAVPVSAILQERKLGPYAETTTPPQVAPETPSAITEGAASPPIVDEWLDQAADFIVGKAGTSDPRIEQLKSARPAGMTLETASATLANAARGIAPKTAAQKRLVEYAKSIQSDLDRVEVPAAELQEGQEFTRGGEKYKVTDVQDTGFPWEKKITVKDGMTFEMQGDEAIDVDRGSVKTPHWSEMAFKKKEAPLVPPEKWAEVPFEEAGGVAEEQPKGELNLGLNKGTDLRTPERENRPVTMDELPLGRATNEAADRERQGGLFDKVKDAYKRSPFSSEGGSIGEKSIAPAFYSKAESIIKQFLPENASPRAVLDLMKQHKVKADDLAHSGLEDFVAEVNNRNAKVKKSDLLAFMQENQAKIVPVEFSSKGAATEGLRKWLKSNNRNPQTTDEWGLISNRLEREAQQWQKNGDAEKAKRYFAMSDEAGLLSEGVNPESGSTQGMPQFDQWKIPGESIPGSYVEHFETVPGEGNPLTELPEGAKVEREFGNRGNYTITISRGEDKAAVGGSGRTFEEASKNAIEKYNSAEAWRDGHAPYSEVKNPIVRWRGDGRTDADGKRVFFIHEIQAPSAENQAKMPAWARKRWREIGLKSALRYAAENGYDSLSLATGEQVAGLYDLSKQVTSVTAQKLESGKVKITVLPVGMAERRPLGEFNPQELPDAVGKDLANKIVADINNPVGENAKHHYSGLDLKVGGEGIKKLYDRDLPGILNDLGKKFGVKSEKRTMNLSGIKDAAEQQEALDVARRHGNKVFEERNFPQVTSLDIPASMKSDVTYRGQELYSFPAGLVKALKPLVNDAKAAYPHLVELGQGVMREGHTKYFEFRAQMKKHLGDMWEAFKHLMEKVFFAAKKANQKLGERGSVGEPSRPTLAQWMKAVEDAIAAGKNVPQRVIDDYVKRGGKVVKSPAKVDKSEGEGLQKAVEKTAKGVDDFVDETLGKAGLAVKDASKVKQVNDEIILPKGAALQSENPDAEFRWRKSKGAVKQKLINRIKESAQGIFEMRKHTPGLLKEDAKLKNILREYENVPEYSKHVAMETTSGILAGLGPKKYDVFTRNIVLPDMLKDIESGLLSEDNLPFGYKNRGEVVRDLAKFKAVAAANSDIKAALDRREEFNRTLRDALVDKGLLPDEVKKDDAYFHHQVLQYMDAKRMGVSSGDVRLHKKSFQKGRKGSGLDYNTEYVEAEFEWISQAISQLKTSDVLERVKNAVDISERVKADAKARGLKNWRDAIPEDYTTWQPKKGSSWYKSVSVPEKVLDEVMAGERELTEDDLKTIIAVGGKRQEWVVPERVAKVLDEFRKFDTTPLDDFTRGIMSSWKQWTLLNPMRVLKYNLNNMSGDMDITMAYDPRILKYLTEAWTEAKGYYKGKAMTPDMRKALEGGVIQSGLTVQEIPDIRESGIFQVLVGEKQGIIDAYWSKTKGLTTLRENLLRMAAFKYFKAEIAKGKKVYGASVPSQVDAETNVDKKAAILARDLIGDYGNVSKAGQWLRTHMVPFFSWMEINAPRYVRLMRNMALEERSGSGAGRMGVVAAGKVAKGGAKLAIKATALYTLISLWNEAAKRMLDMDDDEERGLYSERKQFHIILGRREDGSIMTLRFQGALSDALDWFGMGNAPATIKDIASGENTVQETGVEMAKAPVNRIVNASHPVLKTGYELLMGKSIYPDVFNPRPIRDRKEHVSRLLSLDMPYRYVAGKPTRGAGNDLLGAITYSNDPGEGAYWNARKAIYKFLEQKGQEQLSITPTEKSNALYYYKQARRYGDEKAEEKYLGEYVELGGTVEGYRRSMKEQSPLEALPQRLKWQYKKQLSAKDRQDLQLAERWYADHMKIDREDMKKIRKMMRDKRLENSMTNEEDGE